MLKYRLIFGFLMTAVLLGLLLLDSFLDGTLTSDTEPLLPVKATIFTIFLCLVAVPAQLELKNLLKQTRCSVFLSVTVPASMLIILTWYLQQFYLEITILSSILIVLIVSFWLIFFIQGIKNKTENVILNVSSNLFAIFYLAVFSAFILGIRIDFGLWPLLMYIFTIKSTDIGAYFVGKKFGKTKFAPVISPKKSWEGMIGGIIFSILTAVLFAHFARIMELWYAVLFAVIMAFSGQLSDLAESMLKRDANQKDSSAIVPGFGGLLDVIDSLLLASPLAYVFFKLIGGN